MSHTASTSVKRGFNFAIELSAAAILFKRILCRGSRLRHHRRPAHAAAGASRLVAQRELALLLFALRTLVPVLSSFYT